MKRIYRGIILVMCIILWTALGFAVDAIGNSARNVPYRNAFSFPAFLNGTDIYLWSITSEAECASLILQNIGDSTVSNIEIVFLSHEKKLVFEAKQVLPGQKISITEKYGADLLDAGTVVCASFSFE